MKKYPSVNDIQKMINTEGIVQISFDGENLHDIIHPYSLLGYEYLSGEFVSFLDRFKGIIPPKMPILLKITGREYSDEEKETIDNAIWMHYGLYLSEASSNLKRLSCRILIYILLMILSSSLLFLVKGFTNEVITNYGYLLFWFFGYRILTHLVLDLRPIFKDYQWYRRLASLKIVYSEEEAAAMDADELLKATHHYEREADQQTRQKVLVEHMFKENARVSLGCRIGQIEDVVISSGIRGLEIVSDEMTAYLMGALPFIRHETINGFEIEGGNFTKTQQERITKALRNRIAFIISEQNDEYHSNKHTITLFGICLLFATAILFLWGQQVDVAIHEFFLILLWFFGDYLLEFVFLSRAEIKSEKKLLEKLANMPILFK